VKDLFYRILTALARLLGNWVFLMIAWFVATGYFLFFPSRVAVSIRFYQSLFPQRRCIHAFGCAWRQYHAFVHVFLDRHRLAKGEEIRTTFAGWEHVVSASQSGRGGIILMSHVGSWEIAARLLQHYGQKHPGIRLLLYLGAKHKEQIERRQKMSVEKSGIRIVSVPEEGGSATDILEGLNFLREGGLVSLTGDRLWGGAQKAVTVRFAGGEARVPEIPYILAMLSGAPILIFFGYRAGRGGYHLVVHPPLFVAAASRAQRRQAIERVAQSYADLLAGMVRTNPGQWFHFEPFLLKPESEKAKS
jgi:predicted LPLAT superfamily acyltransferase